MKKALGYSLNAFGLAVIAVSLSVSFVVAKEPAKNAAKAPNAMAEKPIANDKQFHKNLLDAAAKYTTYKKVDNVVRVASALCTAPIIATSTTTVPDPRYSTSRDTKTHGQKAYFLYVKDEPAYKSLGAQQAIGQTIVKEAWEPGALPPKVRNALFIMTKTDPKSKGTDDGWIYGTVTADGKTVTSSGRVESCMGCHVSAPHDRLFGVNQ